MDTSLAYSRCRIYRYKEDNFLFLSINTETKLICLSFLLVNLIFEKSLLEMKTINKKAVFIVLI